MIPYFPFTEPRVMLECEFDYFVPIVAGSALPVNLCYGHWAIVNRR